MGIAEERQGHPTLVGKIVGRLRVAVRTFAAEAGQARGDLSSVGVMPGAGADAFDGVDRVSHAVVSRAQECPPALVTIAGGRGEGILFRKGEVVGKVPQDKMVEALVDAARKMAEETDE